MLLFDNNVSCLKSLQQVWKEVHVKRKRTIDTFLPLHYWSKSYFYLLVHCQEIVYRRLPNKQIIPRINHHNYSVKDCFNPLYIQKSIGKEYTIKEVEKMAYLIIATLQHSNRDDLSARFVGPMSLLTKQYEKRPSKQSIIEDRILKLMNSFLQNYNIFKLRCFSKKLAEKNSDYRDLYNSFQKLEKYHVRGYCLKTVHTIFENVQDLYQLIVTIYDERKHIHSLH